MRLACCLASCVYSLCCGVCIEYHLLLLYMQAKRAHKEAEAATAFVSSTRASFERRRLTGLLCSTWKTAQQLEPAVANTTEMAAQPGAAELKQQHDVHKADDMQNAELQPASQQVGHIGEPATLAELWEKLPALWSLFLPPAGVQIPQVASGQQTRDLLARGSVTGTSRLDLDAIDDDPVHADINAMYVDADADHGVAQQPQQQPHVPSTPLKTLDESELRAQLHVLVHYLRVHHNYCVFCGCGYDNAEDMNAQCPGEQEDLH